MSTLRTALPISAAAILLAASSHAAILGQLNDGDVYSIDTGTGVATLFADQDDYGASDDSSPNGLGYNGDIFNTSFVSDTPSLVRNGVTGDPLTLTGRGVSGGFVSGDTYYYIANSDGNLYSVDVSGWPGGAVNDLGNVLDPVAGFGDLELAPDGNTVYLSYFQDGQNTNVEFGSFTLTGAGSLTLNQLGTTGGLYAGLAYDGGSLYGLTFDGQLHTVNTADGSSIFSRNVTDAGGGLIGGWTDASVIPLPAPALLLLCGIGALFGVRRRKADG